MEAAKLNLVKSFCFGIELPENCKLRSIANKGCLGFVEPRDMTTVVHVFDKTKRKLFTAGLSTEETERRRIEVDGNPVAMNSTCLLSFDLEENKEGVSSDSEEEGVELEVARMGLMKKDFWI